MLFGLQSITSPNSQRVFPPGIVLYYITDIPGGEFLKYKIGDVAKILGISPDLLRYYEKKGIVHPEKDPENDYRYYEPWDINFLIDCLWYKGFGFSLEQIARMITQSNVKDLIYDMSDAEEEIKASILRQELLLKRSRAHVSAIQRMRNNFGKCDLVHSPEVYRYLNRYNFIYDNSKEQQALSQRWLAYMPFVSRCFEIKAEDLSNDTDNYSWGLSLEMEYVEKLGVPLEPPVEHLESVYSVHSFFKSSGKTGFSPRQLERVMEYINENGLSVSGSARGNLVCSVIDEGKLTGFFEVWIPVEK